MQQSKPLRLFICIQLATVPLKVEGSCARLKYDRAHFGL
jgi:hypothetical protein